jgi:hypothetical protein
VGQTNDGRLERSWPILPREFPCQLGRIKDELHVWRRAPEIQAGGKAHESRKSMGDIPLDGIKYSMVLRLVIPFIFMRDEL